MVGVCSYLLVNFWFTRSYANQSSISAFLTNRVGDMFLTVGMFTVIWSCGNEQKFVNNIIDMKFINVENFKETLSPSITNG